MPKDDIVQDAHNYHRKFPPGKLGVVATKPLGPMLIGTAKPAHVVTPSISARGLVNMNALSVVDAQARQG